MRLLVPALAAHSAVNKAQPRACGRVMMSRGEPCRFVGAEQSRRTRKEKEGGVSCDDEIWLHVSVLHSPGNRPSTCMAAHGSERQATVALWFLDTRRRKRQAFGLAIQRISGRRGWCCSRRRWAWHSATVYRSREVVDDPRLAGR